MPANPSVLVQNALLNESQRNWEAAIECLERAAESGDPKLRTRIAEIAGRIALGRIPRELKERAQDLAGAAEPVSPRKTAGGATRAPAAPSERPVGRPPTELGIAAELAAAQALLITPNVVRALREVFAGSKPVEKGFTVPVEDMVSRLLDCELDLSKTVDLALDLVLEATHAARGFILVRNEKGHLQLSRSRGLGQPDLSAVLSTSILAEAERTAAPVFLDDASKDPRFGARPSVEGSGVRSVACVPILDPGTAEVLGVVYVDDSRAAERFPERAKDLLRLLAQAIAPSLRDARRFEAQRVALRHAQTRRDTTPKGFVGQSKAIRDVVAYLAKLAKETVPVLIEGESGSGKELAARVLHDLSDHCDEPFVAENLAALPEALAEAELFGVAKGAFTGADRDRDGIFVRARAGTVFLDEVGELSLETQAKLLRVLQEREVRPVGSNKVLRVQARVVAATNRDLGAMAREGLFREDLFYRLRVVAVKIPPLRDRSEDIPLIAEHILERIAEKRGEPVTPLSSEALAKLARRPWRGNVRELENVLWRVALAGEAAIDEVAAAEVELGPTSLTLTLPGGVLPLDDARLAFDRAYLTFVLAQAKGNVTHAAERLRVTRPSFSRILRRLGISRD